jgi:D-threo-aldose 1-dehydrogenase
MDPLDKANIGTTALAITRLGLGGAPMGGLFSDVEERQAYETLSAAYKSGVRYFDTAPLYGSGKSERFFGEFLSTVPRDEFVLSSKVGRLLDNKESVAEESLYVNVPNMEVRYDYSRDGVLRSIEDSLDRLGLDRIDIAFIHDPDENFDIAMDEAFPTLADLRSQGVLKAVGAGMNQWEMLADFARKGDFDCFLLAGRYTLLDYSALETFLPLCLEKHISVILGGPYNSGILASDLKPGTTYFYQAAPQEVLTRASEIKEICAKHNVELKAAALQFGLLHPAIASTIPGARKPAEVLQNIESAGAEIPNDLWNELKAEGLLPASAPTE